MKTDFLEKYRYKIKTAKELREIIGPFPRKKKVIMCHGVFDVVHPGHLRHLLYAKTKAHTLVASLTADRYILKDQYRPHIPQDLRALNLAALELVDFVVIDFNEKPLENISIIQPDLFAKGYEYAARGLPIKTEEERESLKKYGGEIIFTPGDIVYSSSQLIATAAPNITYEKLLMIMKDAQIDFNVLKNTIHSMKGKKIHVVGDLIIDSYTETTMIGGQTKAPAFSVKFEHRKDFIGGAGIVAKHLRSAGADVTLTTVLGDDPLKDFALDDLKKSGINLNPIIDATRPTTHKNLIISKNHPLIKIDTVDNSSISDVILNIIVDKIKNTKSEAIVFSDFRHGIFNARNIPTLVESIPKHVFKVADSQVASRWGNISEYKDFNLITPNEKEARFSLADQDSGIRPLASNLYDLCECQYLILKLGMHGVLTCRDSKDHEALDSFFVLDSFVENLIDPIGAGDALLAYATLAMLVKPSIECATILGMVAAAAECESYGNIPIADKLVLERLSYIEKETLYQGEDLSLQ